MSKKLKDKKLLQALKTAVKEIGEAIKNIEGCDEVELDLDNAWGYVPSWPSGTSGTTGAIGTSGISGTTATGSLSINEFGYVVWNSPSTTVAVQTSVQVPTISGTSCVPYDPYKEVTTAVQDALIWGPGS